MISPVMPTYARADLAFDKGEGVYLYATDGNRYIWSWQYDGTVAFGDVSKMGTLVIAGE